MMRLYNTFWTFYKISVYISNVVVTDINYERKAVHQCNNIYSNI